MNAVFIAALAIVTGALAWVRLAPSDPAKWHVPLTFEASDTTPGAAYRVVSGTSDTVQRLHQIALDTPRTRVLAGDPGAGHVTYITRSRVFGFPDYTTVQLTDGTLRLYARLRFGKSDIGVNAARLDAWLGAL